MDGIRLESVGPAEWPTKRRYSNAEKQRRYRQSTGAVKQLEYQRGRAIDQHRTRPFIAWDGEGIDTYGAGKPQSYVLFGCSTGEYVTRRDGETLTFDDCANLILRVGGEHPTAWHVGFAFDYDTNQILRTLPVYALKILLHSDTNSVRYGQFRIEYVPKKYLRITRVDGDRRETVTIWDIFSFFSCSFVAALREQFPATYKDEIEFIDAGKKRRQTFTLSELDDMIMPYWRAELSMMVLLADRLRDILYDADFPITQWYGPGAIANLVMKRHGIRAHMERPPDEVIEAAQYAYAGGRFEPYRCGRLPGPIWGIDKNSAYPDAIARLPSLAGGTWVRRQISQPATELDYQDIKLFAIYRVSLDHPQYRMPAVPAPPSPIYQRTSLGEILFAWKVDGWYWGPEVRNLVGYKKDIAPYAYIHEVWDFIPATDDKPFKFVPDMYEMRQQWKSQGRPEQLALKLALNSMYGKLAQRVGWQRKGGPPTYHQLEWAGFITSYLRASIFQVLWTMRRGVIAVETDGIYTTLDPAKMGIYNSKVLGEWSVTEYSEIIYLQSGTYFKRDEDGWHSAYRGLDPDSLGVDDALSYLRSLGSGDDGKWDKAVGYTTRFIGLRAAMNRAHGNVQRFRKLYGAWDQHEPREIAVGESVKRRHFSIFCRQCAKMVSPADEAHTLGIPNMHYSKVGWQSTKHDLPWRRDKAPAWRTGKAAAQAMLPLDI